MKKPSIKIFTYPKHLLAIILTFASLFAHSQQISIIGPATPSGDWNLDYNMIQNAGDPDLWELEIMLTDSTLKFRQDGNWTVNWGGTTFPSGTGIADGPNIEATAGNYYVTFNTSSLAYNFLAISDGQVGIGTYLPTEILDVNGNIKFSGELKPGGVSGTNGQVLQSKGNGTMAWTDAATNGGGSVGYGTWGGCDMANFSEYYPFSDTVGEVIRMGWAIDMSGDYAIIGADDDNGPAGLNQGSAMMFRRNYETDSWEQDGPILMDGDASANDEFGKSVAIDGEFAIVGIPNDDGTYTNQGSVIIYMRNSSSGLWEIQHAKIFSPAPGENDYFGRSVDISGEYAIIGSPNDDDLYTDQGSVSIYKRNLSTGIWEPDGTKIYNPDPGGSDYFGSDVAISGGFIVVGAPNDDGPAGADQGSISIYKRNSTTGFWELQGSKIYDYVPGVSDLFGSSVDISGNYAIAGAPNNNSSRGTATIFKRNPSSGFWEVAPNGNLSNPASIINANFGKSVSISGNYAIVGVPYDDSETETLCGSAVIFVRVGVAWQLLKKIYDPPGNIDDSFGWACAIDGTTKRFVISAPYCFPPLYGKVVFGKFE